MHVSTASPAECVLRLLAFAHLLGEKWHLYTVSMHRFMNEVEYLLYVEVFLPLGTLCSYSLTIFFRVMQQLSVLHSYPIDIHRYKPNTACVDTCYTLPVGLFSWPR